MSGSTASLPEMSAVLRIGLSAGESGRTVLNLSGLISSRLSGEKTNGCKVSLKGASFISMGSVICGIASPAQAGRDSRYFHNL
jgi:hypothetical protein